MHNPAWQAQKGQGKGGGGRRKSSSFFPFCPFLPIPCPFRRLGRGYFSRFVLALVRSSLPITGPFSIAIGYARVSTCDLPLAGGGGYSLIRAIQVCAAPSGRVFAPVWSENGYTLCPFWSGIGYGFWRNFCSVWTYLSLQFQLND